MDPDPRSEMGLLDLPVSVASYACPLEELERTAMLTLETVEAEALQLSAAERARLVERLIASLDTDPDVDDAWAAEIERRNVELEQGVAKLLPGAEALAKLKSEFQ